MEKDELPTYGSDYDLASKQGKKRSVSKIRVFFLSLHLLLINLISYVIKIIIVTVRLKAIFCISLFA